MDGDMLRQSKKREEILMWTGKEHYDWLRDISIDLCSTVRFCTIHQVIQLEKSGNEWTEGTRLNLYVGYKASARVTRDLLISHNARLQFVR